MLSSILIILIILWALGYLPIVGLSIPNIVLLSINNHPITLWNILVLLVVMWAIELLPRPFREIAILLSVVWVLSILGFIAVAGLSDILIVVIIVGIAVSVFQGSK